MFEMRAWPGPLQPSGRLTDRECSFSWLASFLLQSYNGLHVFLQRRFILRFLTNCVKSKDQIQKRLLRLAGFAAVALGCTRVSRPVLGTLFSLVQCGSLSVSQRASWTVEERCEVLPEALRRTGAWEQLCKASTEEWVICFIVF